MPINDSDRLLVNDGNQTETITFGQLKEGTVLNDSDLILINDGVKTETIRWEQVKEEIVPPSSPPGLSAVVLSQDEPIDESRYSGKSFTSELLAAGGKATTAEMTATVTGVLGLKAGSDPITANNYSGTSSDQIELELAGITNLTTAIQIGDTTTTQNAYTPTTSEIESVDTSPMYDQNIISNPGTAGWDFVNTQNSFDGSLDTWGQFECGGNGGGGPSSYSVVFSDLPGGGITYVDKVEVHLETYYRSSLSDPYFEWGASTEIGSNGGSKYKLDNSKAPNGWFTIASNGGLLTSFDISCWALGTPPSGGPKLRGIRVDGEFLLNAHATIKLNDETDIELFQKDDEVQPGVKIYSTDVASKTIVTTSGGNWLGDDGETQVSTLSPKQGRGTIQTISGNVVVLKPFNNNCFKAGQFLTVNKPLANVDPVTDPIVGYDDFEKTLTLAETKDLAQFDTDDDVYMTDADGNPVTANISTKPATEVNEGEFPGVFDLTFPDITRLADFHPGEIVGDDVTRVETISSDAVVGEFVPEFGGTYQGLFDPGNGKTYAYFFGGRTPRLPWSTKREDKSGMNSTIDGYANTYAADADYPVANAAKQEALNGFTDWFLPASGEAEILNTPSVVAGTYHWSSTQCDSVNARLYFGGSYRCYPKDENSYESPFYRKVEASSAPQIIYVALTVSNPLFYEVGDFVTQAFTGATGTIQSIEDNVLTLANTNGNFQLNYTITVDGKSLTVTAVNLEALQVSVTGGDVGVGTVLSATKSGTGTVASVNMAAKTMELSSSNGGWVSDYHVGTATKPAIATKAYLLFNADGEVTGYSPNPVEPRAMDDMVAPVLNFPAVFPDTGQPPDFEFPDTNAYIRTRVQVKNEAGQSNAKLSNSVVPQTTTSAIQAGAYVNNAEEVKAMAVNLATYQQRVADHSAKQRQEALNDFEAKMNALEA